MNLLRHATEKRGCMIAPSLSSPGQTRLTRFDDRGFTGHEEFNTDADAERAARCCYHLTEPMSVTEFEEWSGTDKFKAGNELLAYVNKIVLTSADQSRVRFLNDKLKENDDEILTGPRQGRD